MATITALIRRHPVASYFGLTFAISWSGVLLIVGGSGTADMKAQDNPLFPFAVLAMVAGPSVTGLLLTGLIDGRSGLREFRSRFLKWRVSAGWYAIALLAAPVVATAVALLLSLWSAKFVPGIVVAENKAAVLLLVLVVGISAGFFEELGWTGFAVPRLKQRYGVLASGLMVGVLWSAWHFPVVAWGIGDRAAAVPLTVFMIGDGLAGLPAFRVLMVWVYDRTESLFLAMLMHVSITATTLILTPHTAGVDLLAYGLAFAAAVWVVVAVAAMSNHRQLSQPLRTHAA